MAATSKCIPMKKVNWKPISQSNLSKDCFWTKQQDLPAMDDVFKDLTKKFSLPNKKAENNKVYKRDITLRVLDSNRAQNLLILLRAALKNVPHEQVKKCILLCDTSTLNIQFNEGLMKCLPQPHEMNRLQQMKRDGIKLAAVEEFVAGLLDIDRLGPRLECINFKLRYDDMILNLERDIKIGIDACEEVIASSKFKKILQVILSIGNFMNCGEKGGAVGFEFSILPRLNDIKTIDKKSTLLECIVDCIKTNSPDLWDFGTELVQVKGAARLNTIRIEETIRNLSTGSEFLKKELENRSIHGLPDDKFAEMMSPFSLECCRQVEQLTTLMQQMKQSYKKVANVYAFDMEICPMRELFSNIQIFEKCFVKTYSDMCQNPEATERMQQPLLRDIKPDDLNKNARAKVQITRLTEEGLLSLLIMINIVNIFVFVTYSFNLHFQKYKSG